MSEYLPSFIVEPVLRQARRFSRINNGEESPGFLPTVPDFQRWNPTRFWNTSDSPLTAEDSAVQTLARTIQLWTNQLNNLDMISPPLEPMDDVEIDQPTRDVPQRSQSVDQFPLLDSQPTHLERPIRLEQSRTASDTSLNPARELPYRSRNHGDTARNHSQSDPLVAAVARELGGGGGHNPNSNNDSSQHEYELRRGSGALPDDDGMGPLRQRISAVWAGPESAAEKSRLVHALMTERYRNAQKAYRIQTELSKSVNAPDRMETPISMTSGISRDAVYNLSESDLTPTYAPLELDDHDLTSSTEIPKQELGCVHYQRNVKMQCFACEKWYTCRLCHDEVENHVLPRRDTRNMLCMLCNTPQPVSQICRMCNVQAGHYYCAICKLWNNDPEKSIYHCDDCGICRLGEGLGKDFFHCKTCAACMSIQAESTHKCIERSTKCDCPICGEYMFTSNKPVAFMRCGHSIHESCFADWCNTSYKCPICSKSIANMESQFRRLDRHIEEQPMPEEYRNNRAYIFCNDCNSRSITKYHWLGLKCGLCESYNTTQLELLGPDAGSELQAQHERAQEAGVGEAGMTASQSHTPREDLTSPALDNAATTQSSGPALAQSPRLNSPWLLPNSPTVRSVRSVSPVVGSYFGTGQRDSSSLRATTPSNADADDLDFWGRRSPRSGDEELKDESESEESDDDEEDDDAALDDDEDDDDVMDILGHR